MAKAKLFTSPGDRFGSLVVDGDVFKQDRRRKVRCRCDCGSVTTPSVQHLFSGAAVSCGCRKARAAAETGRKNRKHGGVVGGRRAPAYLSWASMHLRCGNPNATGYANYGGRGINVCDRWSGPDGYAQFLADMGDRPPGHTLDRADNDGPYDPDNCRWATVADQLRNRRTSVLITFNGVTRSASEWAAEIGTHRNNILRRLRRGLPVEQILRP